MYESIGPSVLLVIGGIVVGAVVGVCIAKLQGRIATESVPPASRTAARRTRIWLDVVGESHYQRELEEIAGGRTEDGVDLSVDAELVPQDDNPHDQNAVAVQVNGTIVGFLPREQAAAYRCAGRGREKHGARIVGGWYRGRDDRGHFGVKLEE